MIRNALLSMLGVCASLPAQTEPDVIVVDQFLRPGSHYSSCVDAVAAARPGGTIVVRPGAYGLPWQVPIVIDKPIRIVGLESATGFALLFHPIIIRGVNSGVVELRNFGVTESCSGQCSDGIQIHDCAATVILDRVGVGGGPYPNRVVSIQRCAKVYLRESTLDAGEDPILIEDSHVICEGTSLVSGRWTFFGDPPPLETLQLGPGADVTLIRSQVIGTGVSIQREQSALLMDGGTIRVDAASTVAANVRSPVASGLRGAIWLDPGASLQGVRSSIQPWGYSLAAPSVNVVYSPVRVVDATPANPGGSYTAQLLGAHPGTDLFAAIVASPVSTSPFPNLHPSIGTGPDPDYAVAWMDPARSTVIYFGSPTGQVTQAVGAAPFWTTTVLQGVFFGSDNVVRLTPPFLQMVLNPDP